MSFKAKIEAKMKEVGSNEEAGHDLRRKAVAATIGGGKSAAWREYMAQFADENNLDKLIAEDLPQPDQPVDSDANQPVFQRNLRRSYLVGNGNCGADSPNGGTAFLLFGINDIDQVL